MGNCEGDDGLHTERLSNAGGICRSRLYATKRLTMRPKCLCFSGIEVRHICNRCGVELTSENWRSYYRRNHRATCVNCVNQTLTNWRRSHPDAHKRIYTTSSKKRRIEVKKAVIEAYGGKCACCGERTFEFLTIDHIGGGGRQHRSRTGHQLNGLPLYRWLAAADFPKDRFRLLCINCNFATGLYGRCPHVINVVTTPGVSGVVDWQLTRD